MMGHARRICRAHCPRGGARFTTMVLAAAITGLVLIAYPLLHVALAVAADAIFVLATVITMSLAVLFTWGAFAVVASIRRANRAGVRLPRVATRPAVPPRHGGWEIMEAGHDWTPIEGQVVDAEVIPAGQDGVAR